MSSQEYVTLKIHLKNPTPSWEDVVEDIESCVDETHWTTPAQPGASHAYIRITLDRMGEQLLDRLDWTDNIEIMDETSTKPFRQ